MDIMVTVLFVNCTTFRATLRRILGRNLQYFGLIFVSFVGKELF